MKNSPERAGGLIERPVSVALVGVGGYGRKYVQAMLSDGGAYNARLVGAIDPQPGRCECLDAMRSGGIEIFESLEAFYQKRTADLVVLSVPIHLHCPLTLTALRAGSSVLCEKPLAATVQEALEMAEAERQAAGFVAVGYQWSFSEAIQSLKRDIRAGRFGRPLRLKTLVCGPRAASYYGRTPWAGRQKSQDGRWVLDSPAHNAAAHFLHNMLYVLGPETARSADVTEVEAELYRANEIENYDTCALRCRTSDGAELLFYATHAVAAAIGPVLHYQFEDACVYYDSGPGATISARFRDGRRMAYGDPGAEPAGKLWQCVDAARTGKPVVCGIPGATPEVISINAAQESSAIRDFPQPIVRIQNGQEDPVRCVVGLEEALVQCYDQAILPAEHGGIPWAAPGTTVRTADYRAFPSAPG